MKAANTYTGNTSINAGTLTLTGSGSFAGSPFVAVAAGGKKKPHVTGMGAACSDRLVLQLSAAGKSCMSSDRIAHQRAELLIGNLRHFYRSSRST